jgi:hypothetical protein
LKGFEERSNMFFVLKFPFVRSAENKLQGEGAGGQK